MVGEAFSENLGRIMKLLEGREVSSIGVHGMGGVGKTTLVKHVNNRLLQQSEGNVFWVTVSQEFSISTLQDKIARLLDVNLSDEDEEDIRATRLHRALSGMKNSVIILDDVWDYIDMLKVGCPVFEEGCRLIITTRSLEVCRRICCQRVIKAEKLGEEEAWKLFNETLRNDVGLSPRVEGIAKSMAKMCDGLPLGIITVAGSMRGQKAIHTWENALAELKECVVAQEGLGDIKVFKVLKYSFDRLNRNCQSDQSNEFNTIQLCFMYCSFYPEDYEIGRGKLVEKFISEGLLDERKSRRAQLQRGHSILDRLVNVCLLESCVNDDDDEENVKMHDLVRGMALKIGEGKYMVRAGDWSLKEIPNEEEWTEGLEKVSLMKSGIRRIKEGISPHCPNLSTLLLWGNPWLEVIPDLFFAKMQGLCTLDLSKTRIRMLPDSICDMTSLKTLLLEGCGKLESVPYLGKLKALRELNLSGTAIKEAPQGLDELLNLRFLSIVAWRVKMLPRGVLLKLERLQHLNLPCDVQVEIEEVENLNQLEEFGGRVKNVSDFNWFIRTGLHVTCCYKIVVRSKNTPLLTCAMERDLVCDKNELVLCGCNLNDEKVLVKGVAFLTIEECEGLSNCFEDDLSPRFDDPTSLKGLRISKCGGIEWILRSDGQGIGLAASQISDTLEECSLFELDDLKEVVMERGQLPVGPSTAAPTQRAVFSSLKRLTRCGSWGLVSAVPNLEEIAINKWCGEIEEIFQEDEERESAALPKEC